MRRTDLGWALLAGWLAAAGIAGAQELPVAQDALGAEPAPDPSLKSLELRSVRYEASLNRDPFDLPDYEAGKQRGSAELDLRSAMLVGIVRLESGFIALVEDENGDSYALAKGDPIEGGIVTGIDEATLQAWMRNGESRQQIRLELAKEGD